jgi:3-dehydroquinate dehydratase-2
MRIGVLQGPNLNRLGDREPGLYGERTSAEIEERLRERAAALGVELELFQSNHEGELIDWLQQRTEGLSGLLVNAGGLTHTSVCLRDALAARGLPFVEVHLSNVHAREPFRGVSLLADLALGVVTGFRDGSYVLGLEGLVERIRETS